MTTNPIRILTIAALLGCGLNTGVYYAFSSFVMPGLKRLPPAQGIAAMQSINDTAVRPAFMLVFIGTTLLSLAALIAAAMTWHHSHRVALLLVLGAVLYLVFSIGVTGGYNVPLNNDLDGVSANAADAATRWADYLHSWLPGNHLRALGCAAATVAFALALVP